MTQFLIKYHKFILSKEFVVIVFIPLFILLKSFNLPWWLTITGAVTIFSLLLMLTVRAGHLLQRATNNAIFTVCPRCGFANIKIVEICQNCDWQQGAIIGQPSNSKDLYDADNLEVNQNIKKGIYKKIPLPVTKNLSLAENEVVLISVKNGSMRLHTILRNGDSVITNKFDGHCILNWFIATNKRLCFYSEMFGGWRLGYCHSYNDIMKVSTENKIIYSAFLDEVDKMTIETTDATYQLRGLNPKKLYDSIKVNIEKFKSIT